MFVGSRNFDVSESREKPYLNEPGGMNPHLPTHLDLAGGMGRDMAHKNVVTARSLIEPRSRVTKIFLRKERTERQ